MEMGQRIKERRMEMGLTQEELGEKLGLQKSAIAKYENGRVENIKRSTIEQMAKVLDCSPSYLMGFDDLPEYRQFKRLMAYYNALNELGKQNLERFMEDTHPKYKKDGDSDVQ